MTSTDARRQIDDCLLAYCRGVDRLDRTSLASAFHPDAELVDYGPHTLDVDGFCDMAMTGLRDLYTATQHRISNTIVEFDDDGAAVETYVLAYHVESTDDGDVLHTFNGRYLDRFTERDGQWRILRRALRHDWSEATAMGPRMRGRWTQSGRGERAD